MSCREFQEIMYAFIEGNLSEARKRQIESHLKTCASCRHDLAEKKALLSMETQLGEIEPPAYLVSRIMARVRNVPQPRSTWYKLFRLSIPIRIPAVAMVVVRNHRTVIFRICRTETGAGEADRHSRLYHYGSG